MPHPSIGIFEIRSLTASLLALDAAQKASGVDVLQVEQNEALLESHIVYVPAAKRGEKEPAMAEQSAGKRRAHYNGAGRSNRGDR